MKWFETPLTKRLKIIEDQAQKENSNLLAELDKLIEADPRKIGVDLYKGFLFDQYACPSCSRPIGDETMTFNYCPGCGKKIRKL